MSPLFPKPKWSLPYSSPLPADPKAGKRTQILRTCIYIALLAAIVFPILQFQRKTLKNLSVAAKFDKNNPDWTPAIARAGGPKRPKGHAGAIGRWRKAVRDFWSGEKIYLSGPLDRHNLDPPDRNIPVSLHPNMPFVLILMSPFAYMPVGIMVLSWNLLKFAVLIATVLMTARIIAHKDRLPDDWVLALGLGWSVLFIIGDIQHGNTNVFVLGAVVLHLWAYRKNRDWLSGGALGLAVCLKMTPAIFIIYWAYQRNWKLLVATAIALLIFAIIIPAVAVGPQHYAVLTETWVDNLIVPGLIKGSWYPIHINQSLGGVLSRYFLSGPDGNIFWNPDDNPYQFQKEFGQISRVTVSPSTLRFVIRIIQAGIVLLCGWAIGWRKLDRDDGRRALHYGMVVCVLLICN